LQEKTITYNFNRKYQFKKKKSLNILKEAGHFSEGIELKTHKTF